MKRVKNIFFVAVIMLLLCILPECIRADETEFYGQKEIIYTISNSDVRNFCNGGRQGLEAGLKTVLPEGVSYQIEEGEYAITLSLVISFDSYEEYVNKHRALLGDEIVIARACGEEMLLAENFVSKDVQNYLVDKLKEAEVCTEVAFSSLTRYKGTKLMLNGKEYEFDEKVCIMEEFPLEQEVLFRSLYIYIWEDQGEFVAEVKVKLENKGEQFWQQYKALLETHTESMEGEGLITLQFKAPTIDALYQKFRECFGIFVGREQTYELQDDGSVRVKENVAVLWSGHDSALFGYMFDMELGAGYENLSGENWYTRIAEGKVINNNTELVAFSYDAKVAFEEIDVTTYFTDNWGKYTREIIFKLPKLYVGAVGDKIAEAIEGELSDGMSCYIYDEKGLRNYKMAITTSEMEEIEVFTTTFLGDRCKFEVQLAFWGLGSDSVQETYRIGEDIFGVASPEIMNVKYVSSDGEMLLGNADLTKERVKYEYAVKQFKMQDAFQIIITVLAVVTVLSYVVLIIKIVKGRKNK